MQVQSTCYQELTSQCLFISCHRWAITTQCPLTIWQCVLSSPVLVYVVCSEFWCFSPTVDVLLHSCSLHTFSYQNYRHLIFSLAQVPWNNSTYSYDVHLTSFSYFELALNVCLWWRLRHDLLNEGLPKTDSFELS